MKKKKTQPVPDSGSREEDAHLQMTKIRFYKNPNAVLCPGISSGIRYMIQYVHRSKGHTITALLTHVERRHASLWCSGIHGGHAGGHEVCDLL